ncbi:PaaI family thioesterase [Paraconexibacter algicola]|uniref:Acyl-coenzyme A thioesterase THEM4 n=1 Tax=Paraconexibacter algicola TaxID=2133960 RepID=A0A2T4UK01_9ACTN|nr:PaaI family thioesterase [Paraconexibacter algicola]PTL59576.1 PaaI family thioesterase [Paraconexibacter algicola]
MQMQAVDGEVHADLTLDGRMEGAPGLAHGGAIAAALDDLFGGVLVLLETPAVTARLNVEYRLPVPLHTPLHLVARCTATEGRKLHMAGTMSAGEAIVAEASAMFVRVEIAHFEASGVPVPDAWRSWGGAARG